MANKPLKKLLLAPGPTPVSPLALQAMSLPIIHHRSADFKPVLQSVRDGLKWLFQTKNEVIVLTSTGTGGMVSAVNNFFNSGDKVIVIDGGKFGERWTEICQSYGLNADVIKVEWGYTIKIEEVEKRLKADPNIKGVLVQATETSTGVNHDVEKLAKLIKNYENTLFIVDAVSSLVAHDLKTDEWGVDIMVSGSQKGLALPPGLAFIAVSEKAWKKAETSKLPHFYFNLKAELKNIKENQTNFTSPVSLLIGLNEAIKQLKEEGLENVFKRHERLANATRAGIVAMGLKLYAKEMPSNSVTAICAPDGIDGQEIYKILRDKYGITTAGGQGKAKGKIFRIAHLGYADTFDIISGLAAIEMTLKGLGHPITLGKGIAAAEEILMK
ncbi:MAG: alanine--glyoxylate aminotransferase family protein [Nitrospirae bacterium]|nr:alanine--glyoxylate aminotransferase family protein [Nitrospirota bacterium]